MAAAGTSLNKTRMGLATTAVVGVHGMDVRVDVYGMGKETEVRKRSCAGDGETYQCLRRERRAQEVRQNAFEGF